jgi:hypothetical protein
MLLRVGQVYILDPIEALYPTQHTWRPPTWRPVSEHQPYLSFYLIVALAWVPSDEALS